MTDSTPVSAVPSGSAGEPAPPEPATFADHVREANAHWGAQMQKLDSDAVRDAWDAAHDAAISYANTRVLAERRGHDRGVEFQYQQFVKRLDALLAAVAAAARAQTREECARACMALSLEMGEEGEYRHYAALFSDGRINGAQTCAMRLRALPPSAPTPPTPTTHTEETTAHDRD